MKLIVGLGNPGLEYDKTRHNIGFMALDNYLNEKKIISYKNKFDGKYYEAIINDEKVIFLKPEKYINLSGEVIKKYLNFFKIDIKDLLIIYDDLDTECGVVKLRSSGGSGGHNGLKNIENQLCTKDYKRIKVGISNNKNIETKNYVLGKFTNEEKILIDNAIKKISNIIDDYFIVSFENLMNKYN